MKLFVPTIQVIGKVFFTSSIKEAMFIKKEDFREADVELPSGNGLYTAVRPPFQKLWETSPVVLNCLLFGETVKYSWIISTPWKIFKPFWQ